MLDASFIDVPVDVFGGYTPAIPPADLPPGASPFNQDVVFPEGSVTTRGGLINFFGPPGNVNNPIPANANVNGLKTYLTPTLAQRLMAWDSLGNLYKESPQGTLNLLFTRPYINLFYQSTTLFGREYQTFFNSTGGFDIPRQYDDTNWDRVSQVGPGAPPLVSNDNITSKIDGGAGSCSQLAAANITNISQNGNIVTVVTATQWGFGFVNESVVITCPAVPGYNGTFKVATVISLTNFTYILDTVGGLAAAAGSGTVISQAAQINLDDVTDPGGPQNLIGANALVAGVGVGGYNGTWLVVGVSSRFVFPNQLAIIYVNTASTGLANSAAGTVTYPGSIVAGLHQVSVAYITRQGYITMPAVPPASWVAAGMKRALLSQIPIGPSNIVARLLIFTPVITAPATTGTFYSLPNGVPQIPNSAMLINDNQTTQASIDFTDVILIAGFNATYLFTQLELGECSFVAGYNSRMVWLGERGKVNNFVNLTFDGGFNNNAPLGWTLDPVNYAGGSASLGLPVDWGDCFAIIGDGVTATRGAISQSAYKDYLGVPRIAINTGYSVRARIASANALNAGTIHIKLQSNKGGFTTVGLNVAAAQLTAKYAEFTATLTDNPLVAVFSDIKLLVYVDGTPNNLGTFLLDSIEIFQTNAPFNYSTARFSHAFNPESYDGTTGAVQVRPNDGQRLQAGFPIRNNFYLAKDHYLCYVTDDGVNEPSSWPVNEVSATVGICGPNACDWTEEWGAFAERSGLYLIWGGDPVKITPEIQEDASRTGKITWNSINWSAAYTLWVRIDRVNKRILVGAPVNGALTPNVVFVLDYKWLDTAADIAASPMVTYSAFTGKILAHGRGRRWTYWNITSNSMCFAERSDGTAQPFFGNGKANGIIYQQGRETVQLSDDSAPINGVYNPYFSPSPQEEQAFQLGGHQKLLGYMKWRAIGSGSMLMSIQAGNRVTNLRNYTLTAFPKSDSERGINIKGERFSISFSTNAVGAFMQLEKLILCMKKAPTMLVRGANQ